MGETVKTDEVSAGKWEVGDDIRGPKRKWVVVMREGEAAACAVCGAMCWETDTWIDRKAKGKCLSFLQCSSASHHGHGPSHSSYRIKDLPDDRRLPLLPLIILPLLPMLASFEVLSVPVSVRSIAISLRLLAAWILDWTWTQELVMSY